LRLVMPRAGAPQISLTDRLQQLRTTPPFLADEVAEALCAHRPPFGLKDSVGRISGILSLRGNRSHNNAVRKDNQSATSLCLDLAWRLRKATLGQAVLPYRWFGSCAVVGSSGGLLHSRQGKLIDAHDSVFRFNSAPVDAYSADVGARSQLWVASHFPWRMKMRELRSDRKLVASSSPTAMNSSATSGVVSLYCFNSWLGSCHADALIGERGYTLLINPVLVRRVTELQRAHRGSTSMNTRPSTGLIGVALALTTCKRVTLYGFANDSNLQAASTCNHYFDCKFNQSRYFSGKMGHHDWHAQWRLLESLILRGHVHYVAPNGTESMIQHELGVLKSEQRTKQRRYVGSAISERNVGNETPAIDAKMGSLSRLVASRFRGNQNLSRIEHHYRKTGNPTHRQPRHQATSEYSKAKGDHY